MPPCRPAAMVPGMSAKGKSMSQEQREALRAKALARHAARKAAGLPSSNGLPYADAPAKVEPPVTVVPVVAAAAPLPLLVPNPALRPAAPAPRALFTTWLNSPVGRSASDPRMPTDPVRISADLDDRLRTAFLAGFVAGREG